MKCLKNNKMMCILGLTFLQAWSSSVLAANSLDDQLEFNGFVSASIVNSEGINNYSDGDMSPNFHEAAANFYYQPAWQQPLSVSGQVLYRQLGAEDPQRPLNLDYLFVSYDLVKQNAYNLGVRFGRVKNISGLYNRTRDVPQSYPGAWVPSVIYNENLREIQVSLDGANLYGSVNSDLGFFEYQLGVGYSGASRSVYLEEIYFTEDIKGELVDQSPAVNLALFMTPSALPSLTFGYSYLGLDLALSGAQDSQLAYNKLLTTLNLDPNATKLSRFATDADIKIGIHVLSAQYSWQRWVLTGEYIRILPPFELGIEGQSSTYTKDDTELEGYYLQLEWLATSSLNVMFRHEEIYNDRSEGRPSDPSRQHSRYGIADTVAARYFVTSDLSVTLEQSSVEGTSWVTKGEQTNKNWSQTTLRVIYDF